MALALFAGIPVSDYPRAIAWYERFLGEPATFEAHETESVWELAGDRSVYVVLKPEDAGHGLVTIFLDDVDDLDAFEAFVEAVTSRGIEPDQRETYGNGVRKTTYLDPDGNEFGVGGPPVGTNEPGAQ